MTSETGVELILSGQLEAPDFPNWVQHRAERLSLTGWLCKGTLGQLHVTLFGPAALIDAMEAALWLGPADIWVARIERRPAQAAPRPNGFALQMTLPIH